MLVRGTGETQARPEETITLTAPQSRLHLFDAAGLRISG